MLRLILIIVSSFSSLVVIGCGGATPADRAANANTNTNVASNTNSPAEIKLDPANMPPGLSANPIQQPANAPGISANPSPLPKGATPTPGIPSEVELKKPFKPGATPTPGIPSAEELRKIVGRPTNANKPPPANAPPMMKSTNRKLGGRPQ